MRTAEEVLEKYFSVNPIDKPHLHPLIILAMKEFANIKCAEQRMSCARAYTKSDWVETADCFENILNAEEPII